MGKLQSFRKVKLTMTPEGGTAVSTTGMFDLSGLGSSRSSDKKVALDDETYLSVGSKEYETLSFKLPYSETAGAFHAVATAEYDDNNSVAFSIEFNNPKTVGGDGTTITGTGYITSYKPENDNKSLVSSFTFDWEGQPAITPAS